MPTQLTSFRVVGLHGCKNLFVEIQDNKLILVGENGSGKSTLANLIYYFLSKQWARLREYRFQQIDVELNDRVISLSSDQLDKHIHHLDERDRFFPRGVQHRIATGLRALGVTAAPFDTLIRDPLFVRALSRESNLSPSVIRDFAEKSQHRVSPEPSPVREAEEGISASISETFLYLPTYRRIEQDLQSIFRGGSIDLDDLRRSLVTEGSDAYVELIHFGMEDVKQKIEARMSELKELLRTGLNKLTGTYLREVIQGVYRNVKLEDLKGVDLATLDSILARIPDETLPPADKGVLKEKVSSIAGRSFDPKDNVIAHFLLKLLALYQEQQASERGVRTFVDICNVYLSGKQLVYDDARYDIAVVLTNGNRGEMENQRTVELRMLSSGEKQIVSLFSQLCLSESRKFFVVIDEPELSLSVLWQRRFLPDIVGSERCSGLLAVTHSPFIFDNNLVQYVRSVPELAV